MNDENKYSYMILYWKMDDENKIGKVHPLVNKDGSIINFSIEDAEKYIEKLNIEGWVISIEPVD